MQKLYKTLSENPQRGENEDLFKLTLGRKLKHICDWCEGFGHSASDCASKEFLDTTFARMGLRTEWGTLKSVHYGEEIKDRCEKAIASKALKSDEKLGKRTKRDDIMEDEGAPSKRTSKGSGSTHGVAASGSGG